MRLLADLFLVQAEKMEAITFLSTLLSLLAGQVFRTTRSGRKKMVFRARHMAFLLTCIGYRSLPLTSSFVGRFECPDMVLFTVLGFDKLVHFFENPMQLSRALRRGLGDLACSKSSIA